METFSNGSSDKLAAGFYSLKLPFNLYVSCWIFCLTSAGIYCLKYLLKLVLNTFAALYFTHPLVIQGSLVNLWYPKTNFCTVAKRSFLYVHFCKRKSSLTTNQGLAAAKHNSHQVLSPRDWCPANSFFLLPQSETYHTKWYYTLKVMYNSINSKLLWK